MSEPLPDLPELPRSEVNTEDPGLVEYDEPVQLPPPAPEPPPPPPVNENPESTWGKPPAAKAAWVEEYAPVPTPPTPPPTLDSANPESTWGKPPEEKVTWYSENTENYDPATYTGSPTATGPTADPNAAQTGGYVPPVSEGPDYVADDRPPEEVPTVETLLRENSEVDYTPLPGDPPPPAAAPMSMAEPPIDPPVGMVGGSVDVTGVTDEMTVEKFDAQA